MRSARKPAGQKKYQALILCCGNMDRGDDAAGPLCAAALAERNIPARTLRGDTSELLDAWHSAEHVIVVDALVTGHVPAGAVVRLDTAGPGFDPASARCSLNGRGLAQALPLARALRCLPRTLVLIGVEAANFEWAATLSPQVAAAMASLVEAVALEWNRLATVAPPRAQASAVYSSHTR
jgi:hydrogenase maturation protease